VTTDNHGAVYIDSALVSLTATDALSGVAKTTWTLDGAVGTGSAVGTSAIGAHVLTYSSTDVAGNIEATKTVRFSVLSATSLAAPTITPRAIKRNQKLTFVSYLKPGAAAAAARTKLYLYHSETKTVTVKVKGKNKKVKVTYWRLRTTLTFKGTSAGKLTATSKLTKSGKWRAQAVYGGSATWAPASSAFKNFTVK